MIHYQLYTNSLTGLQRNIEIFNIKQFFRHFTYANFRKTTCCSHVLYRRVNINNLNDVSVSIIVKKDATIYSFIIFPQTALHVSDDSLIHQQEHTQTVITTSGTGRTVFATVR